MNAELTKKIIRESSNPNALTPIERYTDLSEDAVDFARRVREIGCRVVLTQGTFDLIHIGHGRYLRAAKEFGDVLIVGMDDDDKARERKGENRPVVPMIERAEMLAHLRYVDLVVLKRATDAKWQLIKLIHPEVLIAVEGSYTDEEIEDLKNYCVEVKVLPRQADTSTSAKVRKLVLDGAETLTRKLVEKMPQFVQDLYEGIKAGSL